MSILLDVENGNLNTLQANKEREIPPSIAGTETPNGTETPELVKDIPPPDGGWTAWLQVLGGFFCFFNTW